MKRNFKCLVVLFFMFCGLSLAHGEAGKANLRMGLGYESRLQAEVNPDFVELRQQPMIFQEFQFSRWTVVGEFGLEHKKTASGAFEIRTRSLSIGAWGRYDVGADDGWKPFLTAGVGAHRDQIVQAFQGAMTERSGLRGRFGVGFGWSRLVMEHLMVEAEARAALVQDRREPQLSFILRAGVQI